jgi:predicted RNase H-like HicB family nuclease
MSIEREYEIVLQSESEGGFSVFVPELPRVATQGETIEEATEMAKEAIEAYLEVMHEDGLPIPAVHRVGVAVHAARAPSSRRSTASRSSLPSKCVSEVWGSHHVR